MSSRLGPEQLGRLRAEGRVGMPGADPGATSVGIVHLGIGAFHRAHQAVFTDLAAAASGDTRWGICGVTQRSARVRDQLAPQDGLYTVLTRSSDDVRADLIGSVRDVVDGSGDPDVVLDRLADPAVRVVTLTVTEKGYVPRNGAPGPAVGRLVRGLQRRAAIGAPPVTVLCCDNLTDNGRMLSGRVDEAVAGLSDAAGNGPVGAELAAYVRSCAFPSSMVDRIVPATTDADRDEVAGLLGCADEAVVVAEPFRQWVIEDSLAGPIPDWVGVGASLVPADQLARWESAKLRILNAAHSTLAYLGALRGYATIAEAVADDELRSLVTGMLRDDVLPTLTPPDGVDLAAYAEQVLQRFSNPALKHTTTQVAMDGSQKLPIRLLGSVRDRLAEGAEPGGLAWGVAGWMGYVADAADGSRDLDDPMAVRLTAAAGQADGDADRLVSGLLGVREIFDDDLSADTTWRRLLVERVRELSS